jgi:hypothetical protein
MTVEPKVRRTASSMVHNMTIKAKVQHVTIEQKVRRTQPSPKVQAAAAAAMRFGACSHGSGCKLVRVTCHCAGGRSHVHVERVLPSLKVLSACTAGAAAMTTPAPLRHTLASAASSRH